MKVPRCLNCGKKAVWMLSGYGCQCFCRRCREEIDREFEEKPYSYLKDGARVVHADGQIGPEWERIPPNGGMLVEFWLFGRASQALQQRAEHDLVGPHRWAMEELLARLYPRGLTKEEISRLQEPDGAV